MGKARSLDDPAFPFTDSPLPGDLLLAELIHRSANDLAVACAEVHIASKSATLAEARDRLATVAARLQALASIQCLLQRPRTATIDLGKQLCELCNLQAEARFADQGAFIHLRSCDIMLEASRGWALLMVVSELLTNAARHAFTEPGGLVQVELVKEDHEIICLVSDNGIGSRSAERGTGTAVLTELALRAGIALVPFLCDTGSSFQLRLPVAEGECLRDPGTASW